MSFPHLQSEDVPQGPGEHEGETQMPTPVFPHTTPYRMTTEMHTIHHQNQTYCYKIRSILHRR